MRPETNSIMANIEQNLRELIKSKGLKLSDVADRMGTTVSNLLSSVKGNPTVSKLEDIAAALQVNVSELLTNRLESALGFVIIGGQTYQLSKPSKNTVQIPTYARYDDLRNEIKGFVKKSVEGSETASKMGLVEAFEFFSLVYDKDKETFCLSLCYADGKTETILYDKFEFCNWGKSNTDDDAPWDVAQVTEEIINDIEGVVASKIQADTKE